MKHRPLTSRLTALVAAGATTVVLVGCGQASTDASVSIAAATTVAAGLTGAEALADNADPHTDGETSYDDLDLTDATTVQLVDGATTVSDDSAVSVDGDVVTITAPGTYVLSGMLTDGQVVVDSDADGQVVLVLDGVSLTSSSTSPVVVTQADETVLVLADGSDNTLSDGTDSGADDDEEDAPNATVFSQDDLTIAGTGSLSVTGVSGDAITSKDGLVVLAGDLTVDATDDGIRGKDYLLVAGGAVDVTAGGDGLKSDNDTDETMGYVAVTGGDVTVTADGDGVDASRSPPATTASTGPATARRR
ncbi:carbohydrate-binding domain-containing protein [Nocardioides sp. T2.26MG-1]|uniref:carbohydrate-binding domain-containing protein n=1 Tax=Nocardioides sp. T2.26MG-1 TaxID=3041166 RepID=UPI0024779B83|nr:carbohydrate-binding domain-containing protein [Nocardioides sp. T2.26MG-1]CAI9401808.1 hypothetical protein HIDPHFAB_00683 [Nocardioides sp. T2.26MG-1]